MCHIQHSPDGNGSRQDTALLCCGALTCPSRMEREIKISFGEGLKQLLLQEKEMLKRQESLNTDSDLSQSREHS